MTTLRDMSGLIMFLILTSAMFICVWSICLSCMWCHVLCIGLDIFTPDARLTTCLILTSDMFICL